MNTHPRSASGTASGKTTGGVYISQTDMGNSISKGGSRGPPGDFRSSLGGFVREHDTTYGPEVEFLK
jgi:hypothetical protein